MTPATTVPPTAEPVPAGAPAPVVPDEEIRLYGHSNLFYWWPVWAAGFILAFLTYLDGDVMAVVPAGTPVEQGQVLETPGGQPLPKQPGAVDGDSRPRLMVSANNNYGVVFVGVLLLVVVITNFIFRGLISVIVVAAIAIVILFVALMGWWNDVLAFLGGLDVRMNAGGYMAIALPLFLIWLFSTFVYDHYVYVIITRGQVRICKAIGDAEKVVDSSGLLLEKKRNDLFRHWLLGLGSGDLHIRTAGPANLDFELFNVLFIGSKMARIQDLLREKEVANQTATA
jgi:hypothetical protein